MSTAVVTGSLGFIGSRVADALRTAGWVVRGVDLRDGPDTVRGDVTHAGGWTGSLEGVDLVVHTAAIVDETADRDRIWNVNVGGTRTVLEAAAAADVRRFVHLSSVAVYGRRFRPGADESEPVRMTGDAYTDSKVASEHEALRVAATRRLDVTVVRPGDIYGPGPSPWTVRPLRDLQAGMRIVPAGGRGVLTPTYVDDLVEGIVAAATDDRAVGQTLNLAGDRGVTVREYLGYFADVLGVRLRSVPAPLAVAGASIVAAAARMAGRHPPIVPETVRYLTNSGTYSSARAAELLGWRATTPLDVGLERTLAWARQEGLLT